MHLRCACSFAVVQAYLDWQDSNDRAAKTMMKYRDVLNRFAVLAAEEW